MADKKKREGEGAELFRTALMGFDKSDVNLYIYNQNKKIAKLEAMLEKAHNSLKEAEFGVNSDYEAQILELREELRRERSKNGAMPQAQAPKQTADDNIPDDFKDMMI